MSDPAPFRLRSAGGSARAFLTAFLFCLTAGYAVGLLFVEHSTGFAPGGVQTQFLGTPERPGAEELRYEKSAREMFVFIHNHVLSLSLVFLALGGLVLVCPVAPPGLRRFLAVEPFMAIITTFGGIALVRYASPLFSWLVVLSGVSLFLVYTISTVVILLEIWGRTPAPDGHPR